MLLALHRLWCVMRQCRIALYTNQKDNFIVWCIGCRFLIVETAKCRQQQMGSAISVVGARAEALVLPPRWLCWMHERIWISACLTTASVWADACFHSPFLHVLHRRYCCGNVAVALNFSWPLAAGVGLACEFCINQCTIYRLWRQFRRTVSGSASCCSG